jgi:hypothetical protein
MRRDAPRSHDSTQHVLASQRLASGGKMWHDFRTLLSGEHKFSARPRVKGYSSASVEDQIF